MKKLAYEEIKKYIEMYSNSKCKLITNKQDYKDTHAKLILKCVCGDEFTTSFHIFKTKNKYTCNKCSTANNSEKRRLNGEIVTQAFANKNYTSIFKPCEYKNAKQSLLYICNTHNEKGIQHMSYDQLSHGRICKYCNMDICRENNKLQYKLEVENRGYEYIDVNYINDKPRLFFKCNKHPEYGIQEKPYTSFQSGNECKGCGEESYNQKRKKNILDVIKEFEKRNYTYGDDNKYENNISKLKYTCNTHLELGVQTTCYADLRSGKATCKQCIKDLISKDNHYLWKGGISPLQNYMRDKIDCWKKDSFKACDYKCVISGKKTSNLIVHHLYSYKDILLEVLNHLNLPINTIINEYNDCDLKNIEHLLIKRHYDYGLGVVLTSKIHDLFHSIYGRGNNTPEQFEEFKQNYNNGLYKDLIEEAG